MSRDVDYDFTYVFDDQTIHVKVIGKHNFVVISPNGKKTSLRRMRYGKWYFKHKRTSKRYISVTRRNLTEHRLIMSAYNNHIAEKFLLEK